MEIVPKIVLVFLPFLSILFDFSNMTPRPLPLNMFPCLWVNLDFDHASEMAILKAPFDLEMSHNK